MIKIGITGSVASGKTTASKIISSRRGPLFSADKINGFSGRSMAVRTSFMDILFMRPVATLFSLLGRKLIKIHFEYKTDLFSDYGHWLN